MKKIVVLSGAGISAESGIKTFRDSDGLWENFKVSDVADIDAWSRDPELMVDFYNERRRQLETAQPNDAHKILAELEKHFEVVVATQNVDNLHERAGSTHIIHLHGELTKICSEHGKRFVKDIGYAQQKFGEKAPDGGLWRPFIVWFGEDVPLLSDAIEQTSTADVMIVIGTSLNVYPAANLLYYAPKNIPIYVIDPNEVQPISRPVVFIKKKATEGMRELRDILLNNL
ncbi:MAG: NAD-dependent deacylase [Bacteroidales bacterium]|nr:NAD-dependent deacylase [Bacteroidales bacterium]